MEVRAPLLCSPGWRHFGVRRFHLRFSNNTDFTPLPVTLTDNGLTAAFTGEAYICVIDDPGPLFVTLHGPAVIQNFCDPLNKERAVRHLLLAEPLLAYLDFATSQEATTILTELFENGVYVGTETFNSVFLPQYSEGNGEGVANITGTFNSVLLISPVSLAYDNLDAVVAPEAVQELSTIAYILTGIMFIVGAALRNSFARRYGLLRD